MIHTDDGQLDNIGVSVWTHVSHFDFSEDVQQPLFDLRPHAVRYVHPGAGGTLLTSVLKR